MQRGVMGSAWKREEEHIVSEFVQLVGWEQKNQKWIKMQW